VNTLAKFNTYGIIELTQEALKLKGQVLSVDNFASHNWKIINKNKDINIFYCETCSLICGLSKSDNKYIILAMRNISCNELKFYNLLI